MPGEMEDIQNECEKEISLKIGMSTSKGDIPKLRNGMD